MPACIPAAIPAAMIVFKIAYKHPHAIRRSSQKAIAIGRLAADHFQDLTLCAPTATLKHMDRWIVSPGQTGYAINDARTSYPCIIGKSGLIDAAAKREGDLATPLGSWVMRCVYFRPDRMAAPVTDLPTYPLRADLGWCDDPGDAAYNQLVRRPYPGRHEQLWREDKRYDLLVVLGHNDAPPIAGLGSAIFFHLCTEDTEFTAGCVAVLRNHMTEILANSSRGMTLAITRQAPAEPLSV